MRMTKAAIDAALIYMTHNPNLSNSGHEAETIAMLEAAMPHIRKQIARDIRAEMVGSNWNKTFLNGLEYGAYIAEKGLEQ